MKFSDVPCHEVTKRRLQQFVDSDRIPHAILIEGQSGIGKFMMARAFAQYVHCENRKDGDSCGVCPSCIQHQTFNHIDTHFIFPIIKKGSGKSSISDDYIEEWREFLTDNPYMDFEKWLLSLDNINAQPHIYVDESAIIVHMSNLRKKLDAAGNNSPYIATIWGIGYKLNTK